MLRGALRAHLSMKVVESCPTASWSRSTARPGRSKVRSSCAGRLAGYTEELPRAAILHGRLLTPPAIVRILAPATSRAGMSRHSQGTGHETSALRAEGQGEAGTSRQGRQDPRSLRHHRRCDRRDDCAQGPGAAAQDQAGIAAASCAATRASVACIANPQKFIAIGLNYSDHAAESGLPGAARARGLHQAGELSLGPQ